MTDAVVAALAEVEKSQAEVKVPDAAKADGAKPDAAKSDAAKSDATKSGGHRAPSKVERTMVAGTPAVAAPAPERGDPTLKQGGAAEPVAPPAAEVPPAEAPPAESKPAEAPPVEAVKTVAATTVVGSPASEPSAAPAPIDADKTLDDTAKVPASESSTEPPPAESKPSDKADTLETAAPEKTTEKYPVQPAADAAPRAPKETPKGIAVDYFGRTDVGLVREHNEDNFLVVDLEGQKRGVQSAILHTRIEGAGALFAVCDGMGGAAAGEVASQMAVDTIHEMMQNGGAPRDRDHFARRLVRSIEEAGSRIFAAAKMDRSRRGMGTTSTVAGLVDKTLFVGQVGDSRAYVLRHVPGGDDSFALITKDQSLVNQLIEAGQLTEEEAEAFEHSNIILQALGTTEEVTVDLTFLELRRGDRLLMCSDGLSGLVHGDMIKEVMRSSRDLIECANQLIAMANAGGGHDNITVVLADFDGEDLAIAQPGDRVAYQQYPLPPEDPRDPDPAPRSTGIKSGGPKPGSDVKHDGIVTPNAVPEAGGNRMLLVGLLIVVLVLVGIAALLYSGSSAQPAEAPSRATLSHGGGGGAPSEAAGSFHVLTNIGEATLYVDGVARGSLRDDMHVQVEAGPHQIEARAGTRVLASREATALDGQAVVVELSERDMPPGLGDDEVAPALEGVVSPPTESPPPEARPAPVGPAPTAP
ncbi:MAG: protein phosphatase 2C domain-containing protein [Sandaracinus sp.]